MFYLETYSLDPCYNLAFEEYVLKTRTSGDWLILWQNRNTVVVGLNQDPLEEIDQSFVQVHGITVVRRMTGGGAVYHDLGNLNYSFITDLGDRERLTIARFTQPICRALASLGVPAQVSGRNDITVHGRKISGVAQRIEGGRILHHGTLLFDSDPDMIAGALRADPAKFQSKSSKSVRSRVGNIRAFLPRDMELSDFWQRLLGELTADGLCRESLAPEEDSFVRRLANEKYRSWDWTWGRSPSCSMKNRRRWPEGTLEVCLEVQEGYIQQADFLGDFMASASCTGAIGALKNVRCQRDAVRSALSGLDLRSMFGGITLAQILDTIFE